MINPEELNFINSYLVKSGETIDPTFIPVNDAPFIELKIVKRTERTYRVVGLLTLSAEGWNGDPALVDEELVKLGLTPKKKIFLNEHDEKTINWFSLGFILKEIRFKKDGKTPESQYFRIGYHFYKYQQVQSKKIELQLNHEFDRWKNTVQSFISLHQNGMLPERVRGYNSCLAIIDDICKHNVSKLKEMIYFPLGWSLSKRLKFLHFVIAFLQISTQKQDFDWKEIGARYYQEIGGSKEFDPYKDDFINQVEDWSQCPVALLGLVSLGKITPLYFSGQLTGNYSSYRFGPVHSLTDLSIWEESYRTEATTLWLVENRAILTRMAAKKKFLEDMNSLVICMDGHLRSSHKNCIEQILSNGKIKQVIIWTDYDPDGLQISKEAYLVVSGKSQATFKWITHHKDVLLTWQGYFDYMVSLLKEMKMEQEQVLGGAEDWKRWTHH